MTELERRDRTPAEIDWDLKVRRANVLAKSGLAPEYFRGKPDDILVAAQGLEELGVPFTVNTLKQVYVIGGKPGYMAQLQIAMAAKHGHDIIPVGEECNAATATVQVRRRGETEWHRVTFTMEDAATAGLTSKDMYKKWPANMLLARACTAAIRLYCPGVILGIDSNVDYADCDGDRS